MSDKLKPSGEEEQYFQKEEREARERLRQEQQLAAIRLQERKGIAEALHTNDEIANEAMSLGFDADTAPVLPFVPIIQVAWADGNVSNAENRKVLELAGQYGLAEGSPAHNFLKLLISERPSAAFFARVTTLMQRIVKDNPDDSINSNLLDLCVAVAQASGGFFGLTNPIGKEERALLQEFAAAFSVDRIEMPSLDE
ncbi:MAG: TerB family tellurite resistance protein [Bradymonadaceae bacterium]|nr:TerB family tellurite resistance protein [Lujinxingiaceae bacterium]